MKFYKWYNGCMVESEDGNYVTRKSFEETSKMMLEHANDLSEALMENQKKDQKILKLQEKLKVAGNIISQLKKAVDLSENTKSELQEHLTGLLFKFLDPAYDTPTSLLLELKRVVGEERAKKAIAKYVKSSTTDVSTGNRPEELSEETNQAGTTGGKD